MKKTMIFLASVTKTADYESDVILAMEAFFTMEKAEAFMTKNGLVKRGWGGWENPKNFDIKGEITYMEVK